MASKFVVVVGGVYSGNGKGSSAAAIGLLLKMRGERVNLIKCDPYYNLNAGTMNPRQHGEVYLCDDGSETDLDLGHYERLTGIPMSGRNILTNGRLYKELIQEEEDGKYLGETVQTIPHVTDKFQKKLMEAAEGHDILIAEIGGTVGDFESAGMLASVRQFKQSNPDTVMIVMVAPILVNHAVNELKTKPLQNAVSTLMSAGLQPDMLLCRCDRSVPDKVLDKVARLTNVPREAVIEAPHVQAIYQVPIEFYDRGVDDLIADRLRLKRNGCRIAKYRELVQRYCDGKNLPEVCIAVVGKYDNCHEAYLSLKEALIHASVANNVQLKVVWINAEKVEKGEVDLANLILAGKNCMAGEGVQGMIVPGGFDKRGVDGKIQAIRFCRENKLPFLGICLGLQCAVIEFARNVLELGDANSEEFDKTSSDKVIHYVDGQHPGLKKSGTMRLGAYDCELEKDSIVRELYKGKKLISERHRHRYEVNSGYISRLAEKGFVVSGRNPESGLVEMMELKRELHPFFVGTQAHPEFKSKLHDPAPLFDGLIKAAASRVNTERKDSVNEPATRTATA